MTHHQHEREVASGAARHDVAVGTKLLVIEQKHEIMNSVVYAGASGDMNPLHWDPEFAKNVSPTGGVIAHGMYSMGLASRLLTGWAGGPEHVIELSVRFTKPWPAGTTTRFEGEVTDVSDGVATVALTAINEGGEQVLKGTGKVRVD